MRPSRTVVISAVRFDVRPVAGDLMRAEGSTRVRLLLRVTSLRIAGDPRSRRYRIEYVVVPPSGAADRTIRRWPAPAAKPAAPAARAVVPKVGEKARLKALRKRAVSEDLERLAKIGRAEKEFQTPGFDGGPAIRRRDIRAARHGAVLRYADVEIEDGDDPVSPERTVRRARRSDPLTALLLARPTAITKRDAYAVRVLREQLCDAESNIASSAEGSGHVPGHQRASVLDRQLNARTAVRLAMAAIEARSREIVVWVALGGTIAGFAAHEHIGEGTVSLRFRTGARQLAEHYYGI